MDNCSIFLKKKGLTLIELLVVVAIVGILTLITFAVFSPQNQLGKARDAKRKADLQKLGNVLGDYYNDNKCYPSALDCGASLSSYLNIIPCDPLTKESYGYVADCSSYRIYTKLENKKDPKISVVGCQDGCGPQDAYNFGVSSSNVSLGGTPTPGQSGCTYYACQAGHCNIRGSTQPSCPLGGPSFCNDPTCGGGCTAEGGSTPDCNQ